MTCSRLGDVAVVRVGGPSILSSLMYRNESPRYFETPPPPPRPDLYIRYHDCINLKTTAIILLKCFSLIFVLFLSIFEDYTRFVFSQCVLFGVFCCRCCCCCCCCGYGYMTLAFSAGFIPAQGLHHHGPRCIFPCSCTTWP